MTKDKILTRHEDENEFHFHPLDRNFILKAMDEYGRQCYEAGDYYKLSGKITDYDDYLIELEK